MSGHGVEFDPVAARAAAHRLDAMADRLDRNLRDSSHALSLVPAGIDEVSRRATQTFDDVSASYRSAYADGVHELRKLAANLRSHVRTFASAEADSAGALSALQ
jgi:uncharacterized protein YukE